MLKKLSLIIAPALLLSVSNAPALEATAANWVPLLDAKLSHWELWMGVPHESVKDLPPGTPTSPDGHKGTPLGLGNDPKHVFTVSQEDGEPVLHITGEIFGGLTTVETYSNYQFRVQFKWGERKWEPKLKVVRDNGILFHCTGQHGPFWNVWKRSVEFQVEENNMGDLYLLAGTTAQVPAMKGDKKWHYDPAGELKAFGKITNSAASMVAHRPGDFEKPNGEWNTLELYTLDRTAVYVVNGKVVQVLRDIALAENPKQPPQPLSAGQLQIQSEGAECYYRRIEIRSLTDFPPEIRAATAASQSNP